IFSDVVGAAAVPVSGTLPSAAGALGVVAGALAVGTVASAGAAVDVACSAGCVAVGPPNSEGLPLCTCQLFHNSKSEREKIIQRTVRRISIAPVFELKRGKSPTV